MKFSLFDLKNKFDFYLRNKFSFSRKNYCEKNEPKDGLLKNDSREKELVAKYGLDWLKNNSTRQNYLENLYILDLLDIFFHPHPQPIPPQVGVELSSIQKQK